MSRTKRKVPPHFDYWLKRDANMRWTQKLRRGQDGINDGRERRGLNVDYRSGETKTGWNNVLSVSRLQRQANKSKIREGLADWLEPITEEDWEGYDFDPDYPDWWYGGDDDYEYPEPVHYEDDPWYFDDYDYSYRWDVV